MHAIHYFLLRLIFLWGVRIFSMFTYSSIKLLFTSDYCIMEVQFFYPQPFILVLLHTDNTLCFWHLFSHVIPLLGMVCSAYSICSFRSRLYDQTYKRDTCPWLPSTLMNLYFPHKAHTELEMDSCSLQKAKFWKLVKHLGINLDRFFKTFLNSQAFFLFPLKG